MIIDLEKMPKLKKIIQEFLELKNSDFLIDPLTDNFNNTNRNPWEKLNNDLWAYLFVIEEEKVG
jgi:hypothetical protein